MLDKFDLTAFIPHPVNVIILSLHMKRAIKISFKFIGLIILCIAFLFLWSNLRISKTLDEGSLINSNFKICIDKSYKLKIKNNTTSIQEIDYMLSRYITRRNGYKGMGSWHLNNGINAITLKTFYSHKERRSIHSSLVSNIKPCSQLRL